MRQCVRRRAARSMAVAAAGCLAGVCFAAGVPGVAGGSAGAGAGEVSAKGMVQVSVPQGYRVRAVRWDPVLRRSWAVLESVEHPERPTVAVPVGTVPARLADTVAGSGSGLSAGGGLRGVGGEGRSLVEVGLAAPAATVVHAGDQVLLRSEEANIRLQLAAVAEENGGVGDRVRVRLLVGSGGSFEGQETRRVTGIVRGPGEVEMEQ